MVTKSYTITNARTEQVLVPKDKRSYTIGGMDDFVAIAIESKHAKSSGSQPLKSDPDFMESKLPSNYVIKDQRKPQGNQPMHSHTLSIRDQPIAKGPSQPAKRTAPSQVRKEPKIHLPTSKLPEIIRTPPTKSAPTTREEIVARRMALGITTSPVQLERLAASLPNSKEKPLPALQTPLSNQSPPPPESLPASQSSPTSSLSTATTVYDQAQYPSPQANLDPNDLPPFVRVHREDLDEIAYHTRPLTIYHDWHDNSKIANTHIGRLVAEKEELRDRERRLNERLHQIQDLAVPLILGESAKDGSRSMKEMAEEAHTREIIERDEEQRQRDLMMPETGKEMEKRNAPMLPLISWRSGERFDRVEEEDEEGEDDSLIKLYVR